MPGVIDPETLKVMGLPGIWSPVQWKLTEEERVKELEAQTVAGLLWSVDIPEAVLRLLLQEAEIRRLFRLPEDYDLKSRENGISRQRPTVSPSRSSY